MAKTELVTVRHKKNRAITRKMTVNSAKMNSRMWEIIDPGTVKPGETQKKNVGPVAVSKPGNLTEAANSFVNEANDDLAQAAPFTKIEDTKQPTEKEILQKEYRDKSGKEPDGRWNEAKLRFKIKELNGLDDEAA